MCLYETKLLDAVVGLFSDNVAPMQMSGGTLEVLKEFQYLGSLVEAAGRMTDEVEHHIVQVSKAFGSLCDSLFMNMISIWRPRGCRIPLWR